MIVFVFLLTYQIRGTIIMATTKFAKAVTSVVITTAAVVLSSCAGTGTSSWGSCGVKEAPACKGMNCKGQNGCKGSYLGP